jgi:hypothetical protein
MKVYGRGTLHGREKSASRHSRVTAGTDRIYKRLGGPQSRPERYGEEKNLLPLYGNRTPIPPDRILVIPDSASVK